MKVKSDRNKRTIKMTNIVSLICIFICVSSCLAKLPQDWECAANGYAYYKGDSTDTHFCCVEPMDGSWSLRSRKDIAQCTEMVLRFPNASQKACRCNNETTLPAKVPPTPVTESNDYVSDDVKKKEQNPSPSCSPIDTNCCNGKLLNDDQLCSSYNEPIKKKRNSHNRVCGDKTYRKEGALKCCGNHLIGKKEKCSTGRPEKFLDEPNGKKKSLLYGYIFTVPLRRRRRGTDECKYKGKLYLPRSEDETFIRKRMKVILSDCGKRLRRNRTYILYAALKPNELGDYLQIESDNILTVTKKLAPKLTKFWRSSK